MLASWRWEEKNVWVLWEANFILSVSLFGMSVSSLNKEFLVWWRPLLNLFFHWNTELKKLVSGEKAEFKILTTFLIPWHSQLIWLLFFLVIQMAGIWHFDSIIYFQHFSHSTNLGSLDSVVCSMVSGLLSGNWLVFGSGRKFQQTWITLSHILVYTNTFQ